MSNELLDTTLKGLLVGPIDRFLHVQETLPDTAFTAEYGILWKIILRVHDVSRQMVDARAFHKVLPAAGLPVETVAKVEELWDRLRHMPTISDADFFTSVSLLQEDMKVDLLGQALTDSLEILRVGTKDDRGTVLHGPDDAMAHYREATAEVESVGAEQVPEFNIRTQKDDILAELGDHDSMDRVSTGIVPLDDMSMGGHGKGELWLPVAGTGVGKSMLSTNIAWHRLIQGDNVVYFTTETLFRQIRHRILVRHTHLPQFGLGRDGLSSSKIRLHSDQHPMLSPTELAGYIASVEDFTDNPTYGQLVVCQIPDRTRMSAVEAKLYRWQERLGSVDYCIIDSLDMLSAEVRRTDERAELNEVVNKAKALAVGFDGGRGLRVLAPWQASRHGQEEAKNTGRYKINALGDTHMAAKRADLILALLEDDQAPGRIKGQTLKFRDATPEDFELKVLYDHGYIGSDEHTPGRMDQTGVEDLL